MDQQEIIKLVNLKHDFEVGVGDIGVTLRRGVKWAGRPVGTKLQLVRHEDPEGKVEQEQGEGVIVGHWVGHLRDLPAVIIEKEHEATSRLYTGLLNSLRRAYGTISESEYFTALFYKRTA